MKQSSANGGKKAKRAQLPVRFIRGDRYIDVTFQMAAAGGSITGECPELGTAAFGRDHEEARAALIEAVILQLETLEEVGELEAFLKENGVELTTEQPHWTPVSSRLLPV